MSKWNLRNVFASHYSETATAIKTQPNSSQDLSISDDYSLVIPLQLTSNPTHSIQQLLTKWSHVPHSKSLKICIKHLSEIQIYFAKESPSIVPANRLSFLPYFPFHYWILPTLIWTQYSTNQGRYHSTKQQECMFPLQEYL